MRMGILMSILVGMLLYSPKISVCCNGGILWHKKNIFFVSYVNGIFLLYCRRIWLYKKSIVPSCTRRICYSCAKRRSSSCARKQSSSRTRKGSSSCTRITSSSCRRSMRFIRRYSSCICGTSHYCTRIRSAYCARRRYFTCHTLSSKCPSTDERNEWWTERAVDGMTDWPNGGRTSGVNGHNACRMDWGRADVSHMNYNMCVHASRLLIGELLWCKFDVSGIIGKVSSGLHTKNMYTLWIEMCGFATSWSICVHLGHQENICINTVVITYKSDHLHLHLGPILLIWQHMYISSTPPTPI